jgi:hypothetical protein
LDLENVQCDFGSNKALCHRQQNLGNKFWLFTTELGVGIQTFMVSHVTDHALIHAPATSDHRLQALDHLRASAVHRTPLALILNVRIERIVAYLMGDD